MSSQTEFMIYSGIRILFNFAWLVIAVFCLLAYLRTKKLSLLLLTGGAMMIFSNTIVNLVLSFFIPYLYRYISTPRSPETLFRIQTIAGLAIYTPGILLLTTGMVMEMIHQMRKPASGFPVTPPYSTPY